MEEKNLEQLLAFTLGNHIRDMREQMELTQEMAAELADLDEKSLGKHERGQRIPKILILYKLRKDLNVSIDQVIDETIGLAKHRNKPLDE